MSPCFGQFMVVSNWMKTSNDSTKQIKLSRPSGSESKKKIQFVYIRLTFVTEECRGINEKNVS